LRMAAAPDAKSLKRSDAPRHSDMVTEHPKVGRLMSAWRPVRDKSRDIAVHRGTFG
jgi:hypothetical protein